MNENMNENNNPEVTAEDTKNAVTEEIEETVAEPSIETEIADETAEAVIASKAESDHTDEDAAEITKKKKGILQIPVIIALCIVAATLLGYFAFVGFFLKEPEGVTWSDEHEDATFYYEFKNDGTFQANVGSIEINSSYQKLKSDDGNTITVGTNFGSFYASAPATYTISGSRLLGNQTLNGTYGEGYDFTLKQDTKKIYMPDVPEDFTTDEKIIGAWVFKYMGYDIYKVTFDKKGYMTLEFVQDGTKYNGVYTVDGSTINFTYCYTENVAVPIDYSMIDDDNMTFMGYNFVREGSAAAEATPDQQILTPATPDE
ncbi:MAG: hypothetical protein IJG87_08065 [Ruminococcus sp.]|nr:hypothetical protein [Ruminococcus sp.]